jgi:hypothetical protein
MPNRCVVYGCSNEPNPEAGITLHPIPFTDDSRPEAKKRRKKWIECVARKRAKWTPGKTASVCSVHFTDKDFERRFWNLQTKEETTTRSLKHSRRNLRKDEVGVSVWPTIQAIQPSEAEGESARDIRRKIILISI